MRYNPMWPSVQSCIPRGIPRIYSRKIEIAAARRHIQSCDHLPLFSSRATDVATIFPKKPILLLFINTPIFNCTVIAAVHFT